jgi:hypothetical protein
VAFNRESLKPKSTTDFVSNFSRVAQTSHYKVEFRGISRLSSLSSYLIRRGVDSNFINRELGEYCRRASVPGTQLNTKEATSTYPGVTQKFAYGRQFSETEFTFYVDYEYKVQKFFELWQEFIMSGSNETDGLSFDQDNYYYRARYPDTYKCERIRLLKFDKDYDNRIEYNFLNAFPTNINTSQISYDASRVLEVTVRFAYDRYVFGAIDSYSKALKEAFNEAKNQAGGDWIRIQKPNGNANLEGSTGTDTQQAPAAAPISGAAADPRTRALNRGT